MSLSISGQPPRAARCGQGTPQAAVNNEMVCACVSLEAFSKGFPFIMSFAVPAALTSVRDQKQLGWECRCLGTNTPVCTAALGLGTGGYNSGECGAAPGQMSSEEGVPEGDRGDGHRHASENSRPPVCTGSVKAAICVTWSENPGFGLGRGSCCPGNAGPALRGAGPQHCWF